MRIATLATQSAEPLLLAAYACSRLLPDATRGDVAAVGIAVSEALALPAGQGRTIAAALLNALRRPANAPATADAGGDFHVPKMLLARAGAAPACLAELLPAGDVRLVRLAVDLYRPDMLRAEGVVAPGALSRVHACLGVENVPGGKIWRFSRDARLQVQPVGPLLAQLDQTFFAAQSASGRDSDGWRSFVRRLDHLVAAGLAAWQGFVWTDFDIGDGSLCAYATDAAQPRGRKLSDAAAKAGRRLLTTPADDAVFLVPVDGDGRAVELRDLLVPLAPDGRRNKPAVGSGRRREDPLPAWFPSFMD